MTDNERVTEALEYRMEEMAMEQERVRVQMMDMTEKLLKLNFDLSEKMRELSTVQGCLRKVEKGMYNKNEIEESRKLFNQQLELVESAIEVNKMYTIAMNSKIDELKMVHEDLTADINAITSFLGEAKKEPTQPLVAVNVSA
jgi:hypothetical protein